MKFKRRLITYLNILDQPIQFNQFVFSRKFLLWALLGLTGFNSFIPILFASLTGFFLAPRIPFIYQLTKVFTHTDFTEVAFGIDRTCFLKKEIGNYFGRSV